MSATIATPFLLFAMFLFGICRIGGSEEVGWILGNCMLAIPTTFAARWTSQKLLAYDKPIWWLGYLLVSIVFLCLLFEPAFRTGTYYKESEIPEDEFAAGLLWALTFPQPILYLIVFVFSGYAYRRTKRTNSA